MTDEKFTEEPELDPLNELPPAEEKAEQAPVEEVKQEDSSPQQEEPKEVDNVQKRINKLVAERYEEKARREEVEKRLAELEKERAKPVEPPTLEGSDYDEELYAEKKIAYQVQQELQKQAEATAQQATEQQRRERQNQFAAKEAEFAAANPGYYEALQTLPSLPQHVLDAITSMDGGKPEVAFYLANHLDVADSIVRSDPIQAAVQLGKISAELNAPKPAPVPVTKAPEPVETLAGAGEVSKSVEEMSMDEIMALPLVRR